jgi:endonuclease-3
MLGLRIICKTFTLYTVRENGIAMLNKKMIKQVLTILEAQYRDTETALEYGTPFQLLISTMLAAQSTDRQVNIITRDLFKQYATAGEFLKLSQDQLESHIKSIGLYKSKAKNILATCKILEEKYHGQIPETREELVKLPGVGRKTANVVLSIVTDFPAIAVDTHVFRVSNRIGLAAAKDVLRTEQNLMANIPREKWSAAHHWLIWHGRKLCHARSPKCDICFLNPFCQYAKKGK